ncbi:MAG: hypothetical protein ABI813_02135 [Bacteroidota bacterium]
MKDTVRKLGSFLTFEYPLQIANISAQFFSIQLKQQIEIPGWGATATRQKLISDYWFIHVARHFALMFGFSTGISLGIHGSFENQYLLSVLVAGILCYPVLYFFHYRPYFSATFLPRLETIKEAYERRELEQMEKCRKAQLPNPTLIMIHYAIDKASGINAMQLNERFAGCLTKLYGVDPRSLKSSMDMLLGSSIKRKDLKGRGRTEISNRFTEAYQFFEELGFPKAIEILRSLETTFFKTIQ